MLTTIAVLAICGLTWGAASLIYHATRRRPRPPMRDL